MRGYERLAEILGAEDVLNYIKELENKVKEAIENDKAIEIDPDFERKIRDRLKELIERRFDENSLNVLKSLAVLDLPIDAEVASKIYDLSALNDFIDLGLIEKRNGYLIVDETLKDLIQENVEDYHRKALEYYSNFEETLDVMTEKAYHHLMLKEYDRAFDYFIKSANQIYGRHRCVEKLIFVGEKLIGKVKEDDRLLGTLGNLYMVLKKYREAEHYYRKVMEMYDENDDRYLGVLLNIANLRYVRGDYKEAEELLKNCVSLAMDRNEEIVEKALLMLSSLYLDLNDYENAEKCLMDVLRMIYSRKDEDSLKRVAEIVNNLGYVYSRSKNYEKAERFYKEALRIYNDLNDVKGVTTALNNLCSIYVTTQNYEKAKEIIDAIERVGDMPPDLKAKYYFLKAKVLERDDPKSALELYVKAGALGFLIFRNFGINAVNYMHSLDKAEEIAKRLNLKELAGDVFVLKSAIAKVYFGIRRNIADVECGERGKAILNALKGYDTSVEVRDEVDSAFFVILQDLKASSQ
ncbi:tetratricopeptide repeat protein [Archaeoglobus profundus]|uniref:TPR repeat-containing protein n=1 Tax=Archaeoglobus profundus (strain DSM 5631 / JCM 9629 / NBRC 100127 / Av18) TaxID=572546 RepID=D2RDB1_ARCPA|nr:tetratricopeptide repeat protein [Archaeoglobus profundus]ADB58105.1 TPR repeat-containing protein [Archaeoglobus profundus DSM 5631]